MIFAIICFIISIVLLITRSFLASFVFSIIGLRIFRLSRGNGRIRNNLDQFKQSKENKKANPVKHTYSRRSMKEELMERRIRSLMDLECLSYSKAKRIIISEYNQKNI